MQEQPRDHPLNSSGWVGVVRGDWPALARGDPFDKLMSFPHETVRDRSASRVYRVHTPRGVVYLKHTTASRDHPSPAQRLLWRVRPSRALAMRRVHRAIRAAGLAVPGIVIAARRRAGGKVEDLLVTDAAGEVTLKQVLSTMADPADRAALLYRVGSEIGELHNSGVIHGDLLPGNLLVQNQADHPVVFIDNDRTRRWPIPPPRRQRRRNLEQMLYRLLEQVPWRAARSLLDGYAQVAAMNPAVRRRFEARALGRVLARLAKAGRTRVALRGNPGEGKSGLGPGGQTRLGGP